MINLQILSNCVSGFVCSVFLYHCIYYVIYWILNKDFPKTTKDLQIESLLQRIKILEKENQSLSEENQKISETIIRRLQQWEEK